MTAAPDAPPPPDVGPTPDEKTWGTMAHVSSIVGAVIIVGLGVLGPLIIWLTRKRKSAYVDHHCKEALNFQVTMLIVSAICFGSGLTCGIYGFMLLGVAVVVNVVASTFAAVAAGKGVLYCYPISLRLVR